MKDEQFHLRVAAADKALVRYAARAAGVSASRFMVEAAVQMAEETVARQNRFVVSAARWAEFAAALDGADVPQDRPFKNTVEGSLRDRDAS